MVEVEGALRESLDIYKKNPVFVLPHFLESILSLGVIISIILTILLSIGVHVVDVALDDPETLTSQIMEGGQGLLAVIILTLLFGVLMISIIKAAALAGVVQMANRGFKGEKITFSDAVDGAKSLTFFCSGLSLALFSPFSSF
jgi:membrane-anchored glycerophosphoryl diester phosphodiesterase (GDPDase)